MSNQHVGKIDLSDLLGYNDSQKYPGDMSMSICIAALCDNKETIICMCDKLITRGDKSHETTTESKMKEPTNFICIMLAGGLSKQTFVYYDVFDFVLGHRDNLAALRIRDVIDAYVMCHKDILTNCAWIDDKPTSTIIAGYDIYGGHIAQINNGKEGEGKDQCGHLAVGTGAKYVGSYLDAKQYNGYSDPFKTLLLMYVDKKHSEADPYVGASTDILIIQPGGHQQHIDRNHGIYILLENTYKNEIENSAEGITDEVLDSFSRAAQDLFKREPLTNLIKHFL